MKTKRMYGMYVFMMCIGVLFFAENAHAQVVLPDNSEAIVLTTGGESDYQFGKIKGIGRNSSVNITISPGEKPYVVGLYLENTDESYDKQTLKVSYDSDQYSLNKDGTWDLDNLYLTAYRGGEVTLTITVDNIEKKYKIIVNDDPTISICEDISKKELKKISNVKYNPSVTYITSSLSVNAAFYIQNVSRESTITIESDKNGFKVANAMGYYVDGAKPPVYKATKRTYNVSSVKSYDDDVKDIYIPFTAKKGTYNVTVTVKKGEKSYSKQFVVQSLKYNNPIKSIKFGNETKNYAKHLEQNNKVLTIPVRVTSSKDISIKTKKGYTVTKVIYVKRGEWQPWGTRKAKLKKSGKNTWKATMNLKNKEKFWEVHIYYKYKTGGKWKKSVVTLWWTFKD